MNKTFTAFIVGALLMTGCAQDVLNTQPEVRGLEGAAPIQTLNDPESGTDVILRPSGKLRIELDANATTGYFWTVTQIDETKVALLTEVYESDPSPPGMVGVGGTMVFEFEAVAAGKTDLELTYQRSPQDVFETIELNIQIQD